MALLSCSHFLRGGLSASFALWRPFPCVLSFMLCVLGIRSTVLPEAWGDNPGSISYSTYLTGWVTHDPSTGVRATTVLSFPQPTPLLWRTDELNRSHDFSRQISPFCVWCSIMEMCSFGCCMEGDGEGGKRGTGGENPEGEGGLQPGCPPFPGLSPQDDSKPVLRVPSTQKKSDDSQTDGH